MTLQTSVVLITLALLCVSQSATAQGNLVVNGGFDTDASGLTITNVNSSGGGGYQSDFGNPPGSVRLNNLSSPKDPTASQIINGLTPGIFISFQETIAVEGKMLRTIVLEWHSTEISYLKQQPRQTSSVSIVSASITRPLQRARF